MEGVLTHLTSRSPTMRKFFLLTDKHAISIRARFIRSDANVWADRLNRKTYNSDWQLAARVFRYYDKRWGPHSVDRFASFANKQLPRHNAKWRDGKAKAVDFIHLVDQD